MWWWNPIPFPPQHANMVEVTFQQGRRQAFFLWALVLQLVLVGTSWYYTLPC